MKILFCDIDSTINNHWVRIQKWATPSFPGTSIHQKAFTREEIMKDLPIENAVESIEKFSKEYEIHFLTARPFNDAYNITKDWLDNNGFKYESLVVVKSPMDKLKYVTEDGCLFIDDLSRKHETNSPFKILYWNVISELNKNNVNYIIFKNNWKIIMEKYLNESV